MKVIQIDTPALILEKSIFEENRRTMASLMDRTGIALRPHYKSHKCPTIAKLQLSDGAIGICCAKLSEAEDLADCGIEDIFIANQIVQSEKMGRLAVLAARCHLSVCVDSPENILKLEAAVAGTGSRLRCLVEYEVGLKRCGVETHEEVLTLAKLISQQPHLTFGGVQAYAGNMAHEPDLALRQSETARIEQDLIALKEKLVAVGLPPEEIGGVSTGTMETKPAGSVYTAAQCGSYILMDRA